jgi:penicillin-binding protein 1A
MDADEYRAYLAALEPPPAAAPAPAKVRLWPRIVAGVLLLFFALLAWLALTAPLGKALEPLETPAIVLTADDGSPIARRGSFKAEPVDVTQLPDYVGEAFVAIEDKRFYEHFGIDLRGIARAAQANAEAGRVVQGGSTITQQLAKTSFLSLDRSLTRKAQEVIIALWLEAWLSKDEILSRYLSSVYFGDGAYGIRAASEQYFSKTPDQLTLGEAAMLAGLVKAPSRLAPTKNYDEARARGKLVIAAMKEQGLITDAEWRSARRAALKPGRKGLPSGSYFADWVWPDAADRSADTFGEVTVETTLDADMQAAAERVVRRALDRAGWHNIGQAALVAMRPDGRVVAMVGGKDYKASVFNRAVQAKRQPGSAFKLFVYLAALRDGMTPDTRIDDSPVTIGDWSPKNSDGKYRGDISLKQAFALSSNVAAAKLANEVGAGAIRRAARDLGIKDTMADDLTIALGTPTMSLLDLTAAYASIAGGSPPVRPYGITVPAENGIASRIGGMIGGRSLPERRYLQEMMRATIDYGTGVKAKLPIAAYGKTGTTQDERDAVFVGFAGEGENSLIVGVWVGNDDNSPMKGVLGSTIPAVMWRDFMTAVHPDLQRIAERREAARRRAEDERRSAELDLAVRLGPEVEAVLAGDRIDIEMAGRVLGRLGEVLANTPEDAERIRDAAERLEARINNAMEREADRLEREAEAEAAELDAARGG